MGMRAYGAAVAVLELAMTTRLDAVEELGSDTMKVCVEAFAFGQGRVRVYIARDKIHGAIVRLD